VAELSPDPDTQAQRLVAAAMAAPTGQTEWIQDWPPGPCADPGTGLRLVARRLVGWALAWSSQHAAALSALIPVAREASRFDRLMAWDVRGLGRLPVRGTQGSAGGPRDLALLEDAAQPSLDPARAEHALAELHAHERLEVGPGGACTLVPRPRRKVSACHTAMSRW
jgi:hypothetical protein